MVPFGLLVIPRRAVVNKSMRVKGGPLVGATKE